MVSDATSCAGAVVENGIEEARVFSVVHSTISIAQMCYSNTSKIQAQPPNFHSEMLIDGISASDQDPKVS